MCCLEIVQIRVSSHFRPLETADTIAEQFSNGGADSASQHLADEDFRLFHGVGLGLANQLADHPGDVAFAEQKKAEAGGHGV